MFFDKLFKNTIKSAKVVVKKEINKGVNNGVATGIRVVSTIATIALFCFHGKLPKSAVKKAAAESAKIVNNYYFIGKEFLSNV